MDRHDVDWWGYWPAAPTPFDALGRIDLVAWRSLLELYIEHGVHGVLVNGSSGEWFSQTRAEREILVEVAVEAVAGRIPLVVGVTAFTAGEAAELALHAASVGADGVLATPPPYVHPSPAEILAFYGEVSSATALPFMVYNWPRGVSVDIAAHPALVAELADLDQVVAIKDSTGNWLRMLSTVEQVSGRVRVFGSFLHRRGLAVLLGLGGDGNIDGGGVGAPFAVPFYVALSQSLIRADYSGRYASPVSQLKAVMKLLGQPGGEVRPPLLPLTDAGALAEISSVLATAGLLGGDS
jgi:dihydrodipicolinate synthase/N-acetylneuraminate lyase